VFYEALSLLPLLLPRAAAVVTGTTAAAQGMGNTALTRRATPWGFLGTSRKPSLSSSSLPRKPSLPRRPHPTVPKAHPTSHHQQHHTEAHTRMTTMHRWFCSHSFTSTMYITNSSLLPHPHLHTQLWQQHHQADRTSTTKDRKPRGAQGLASLPPPKCGIQSSS